MTPSATYRPLPGREVNTGQTMAADFADMVPGVLALLTGLTPQVGFLGALAFGVLAWVLNPLMARTMSSTSLGGMLTGLKWQQPNGRDASLFAHLGYLTFGSIVALVAIAWWAGVLIVMPWRILVPSTFTMFSAPNTPLFGVLATKR